MRRRLHPVRNRLVFSIDQVQRAPERYCFFAVDETVWFGDKEQHDRFDADERYADSHELHSWPIAHGDFDDRRTAEWIADALNAGRGDAVKLRAHLKLAIAKLQRELAK